MMKKVLGLLGGMGPESTAYIYKQIIDNTIALSDQEHIPIIIYSNPKIYDRTKYILNGVNNPKDQLITGIKLLENSGVDLIFITCNTAHYFYEELIKYVKVPIINIPELTLKYIEDKYDGYNLVLLATKGTYISNVYSKSIVLRNVLFDIHAKIQEKLMNIINETKRLGKNRDSLFKLKSIIKRFEGTKNIFILGCTELSMYYSDLIGDKNVIVDASLIASKFCIKDLGYKIKV